MQTNTDEEKKIKYRYLTIRIASDIEQELRKKAEIDTRSLAAQIMHYIKQGIKNN